MLKTPLSRASFGGNPRVGWRLWYEWYVLPWFKKLDYRVDKPERPYYRWQRLLVYKRGGLNTKGVWVWSTVPILGKAKHTTSDSKLFTWDKE